MTLEEILDNVQKEINRRARFDQIDHLIEPPGELEMNAAIYDAVDDLNSFPPQTFITLENMFTGTDTRWRRLLYLGATVNIITLLVNDWPHHGFTQQVEEFTIENKLSEYESLKASLKDEFDDRLEKLKTTSQKHMRGISGKGVSNPITSKVFSFNSFVSRRRF